MAALVGGGVLAVVPAPTVSAAPANRVARISMASSHAASSASRSDAGQATSWPLSHLAVTWTGDPAARVEVRWRDGGGWRAWQTVEGSHDMTDGANGNGQSTLLRAPDATRVDTRSSGDARDLTVIAIDTTHASRQT